MRRRSRLSIRSEESRCTSTRSSRTIYPAGKTRSSGSPGTDPGRFRTNPDVRKKSSRNEVGPLHATADCVSNKKEATLSLDDLLSDLIRELVEPDLDIQEGKVMSSGDASYRRLD